MFLRSAMLTCLVLAAIQPASSAQKSTSNQTGGVIEPPNGNSRATPTRHNNMSNTQQKPPLSP